MMKRIPDHIVRAANSLDSVVIGQGISMTAYNMMKRMGWTGGPLKGGMLAPPPTPEGNRSREMLGFKAKKERSKVVAYTTGDGGIVYGQEREGLIKRYELDPLGKPIPTGENVPWHSGAKPVLRWRGAIKGVAEYCYPHPQGWTFKELLKETPLDRITVSAITGAFASKVKATPTCKAAWNNAASSWHVKTPIDWEELGKLFAFSLITPPDFHLFMKYIVHRGLFVRSFMPEEDGYDRCRCCHAAKETQVHLHRCSTLWPIWKEFRLLVGAVWGRVKPSHEMTFLGMNEEGVFLPLALRAVHAIVWKMIIIEFTLTGMEPGRCFKTKTIFPYVFTRMHTRLSAKVQTHRCGLASALQQGRPPPKDETINSLLYPLASMQGAEVIWHEAWKKKGVEYGVPLSSFK